MKRARRCVQEEPEDPAPLRILRWNADSVDVPVFESLIGTRQQELAVHGMLAAAGPAIREDLVVLAGGDQGVVEVLAAEPRFHEEALFVQAVHQGRFVPAARALGTLGTDTARAYVDDLDGPAQEQLRAYAMAHDWTDEGLDRFHLWILEDDHLDTWFRIVPRDHPLREDLVRHTLTSPDAMIHALQSMGREDGHWPLVAVGLDSPHDEVRQAAASVVARYPDVFPLEDIASCPSDPIRALGYHQQLARSFRAQDSIDWLWEQLADPDLQEPAARALLGVERGSARRELAVWIAERGPAALQKRAESLLRPGASTHPIRVPTPTLSRARRPTADAAALRDEARRILEDRTHPRRPWALAVLPWVGNDEDVELLIRAYRWPTQARSVLADLGTPAAIEALRDLHPSARDWGWSRTAEGWRRMLDTATKARDVAGVVRPEAVQASLELTRRSYGESKLPRHPLPEMLDPSKADTATCRWRLQRGDWSVRRKRSRHPEPIRVPPPPLDALDTLVFDAPVAWLTVTDDGALWVAGREGLLRRQGAQVEHRNRSASRFLAYGRLHLVRSTRGVTFVTPSGGAVDLSMVPDRIHALDRERVALEADGVVQVYDAWGRLLLEPPPVLDPVAGVVSIPPTTPSPDGRWRFERGEVFDVSTGQMVASVPASTGIWRPDSGLVAAMSFEHLYLVDPEASQAWTLDLPMPPGAVAWSLDGRTLWAGQGLAVETFDAVTGARLSTNVAHQQIAKVLYTSVDGRTALSGDHGGRAIVWRRDQPAVPLEPVELPAPADAWIDPDPRLPHSAAVSGNGRTAVVLFNQGDVAAFDARTGALRWRDHADADTLEDPLVVAALPQRGFVIDHMGPGRLTGAVAVNSSGRVVATVGVGPRGDLLTVWRDGRRLARVDFGSVVRLHGFDREGRLIVNGGQGLYAVSTRRREVEELAREGAITWVEDGVVLWGGSDHPRPPAPPPPKATLELGRVVFWEQPEAP